MRIAVIGAGAVGGYFGARLAAAGNDVAFVARGAHGEAIRRDGLRVLSANGDVQVRPVQVLEPGAEGTADVVLVAVKMYDLEGAAQAARPLVGRDTAVIPLENGVEAVDILRSVLPERGVCGGVAYIGGHIESPGVVRHVGTMARLVFGETDGTRSSRLEAFERACGDAGVDCLLAADIKAEIWRKFVFLAPFAGITCYARAPIGPVRENAALWKRYADMVAEAAAVARAEGVALPADIVEDRLAFTRGLPEGMKSSMLTDLEGGRRLELDWLSGAVVRLGQRLGVPTPVTADTYATIVTRLPRGV